MEYLNRVICGDCLETMRGIDDGSIGLVVTSPPYNIAKGFSGTRTNGKWKKNQLHAGYDNHDDKMSPTAYAAWQRECLNEMMRLLPDDGAIFYNHKWRIQNGLLRDRSDITDGFPVRQIIIWQRNGGINFNRSYFLPTFEVIYIIAKPKFKLAKDVNGWGDIWKINVPTHTPHPAPMPLALAERCIRATNAKIVLDPFGGSGTTAIAAIRAGRNYIHIDNSSKYCDMARARIAEDAQQLRLF